MNVLHKFKLKGSSFFLKRLLILFFLSSFFYPKLLFAGSEQIASYSHTILSYEQSHRDSLKKYSELCSSLAGPSNSSADSAWIAWSLGLLKSLNGEKQLASLYFNQALKLAEESRLFDLIQFVKRQQALYLRENGNIREAISLLEENLEFFQQHEMVYQKQITWLEIGNTHKLEGKISQALNCYLKASELDTPNNLETKIHFAIGQSYQRLANLFLSIKSDKAQNYLVEAKRYFELAYSDLHGHSDQNFRCLIKIGMLELAILLKNYAYAEILLSDLDQCRIIPDYEIQLSIKLADARLNIEFYKDTINALSIYHDFENTKYRFFAPHYYHIALMEKGVVYLDLNADTSGYAMLSRAAEWFGQKGYNYLLATTYEKWLSFLARDNRTELFLGISIRSDSIRQNLLNEADNELFDDLRFKHKSDVMAGELEEINLLSSNQRRYLIVLIILLISLIVISSLLVYTIHLRRRKLDLNYQIEMERARQLALENETKQSTIQNLQLKQELLLETAKAASLESEKFNQEKMLEAVRLLQNENLRYGLAERLKEFISLIAKKKDRDAFEIIIKELTDDNKFEALTNFEQVFLQAYGKFYARLSSVNPNLSRTELQIAALLRLNLSTKEIAGIMNSSTSAIEKTRYQLRQKLNVEKGQSLTAFLISL